MDRLTELKELRYRRSGTSWRRPEANGASGTHRSRASSDLDALKLLEGIVGYVAARLVAIPLQTLKQDGDML